MLVRRSRSKYASEAEHSSPIWARRILLCWALAWCAVAIGPAGASQAQGLEWHLVAEGRPMPWPSSRAWPADSIRQAASDALINLQTKGYLYARIDSHRVTAQHGFLYATLGLPATIANVHISGAHALDSLRLQDGLQSHPGRILDAAALEADAEALVQAYAAEGFHLVRVVVGALEPADAADPRIAITFHVDEGAVLPLSSIELLGAQRTRSGFAERVAALKAGAPVQHFDPAVIRARLNETGIFRTVHAPTLALRADSTLIIQIPVTEAPPGAFDLALGYERNDAGNGALVGSGHLALVNMFGHGRTLSLTLNRAPGQISRIRARARDPFAFGLPLGLGAQFEGLQQDSTYGKRAYGLEVSHQFEGRMNVFGTVTREVTRPGLSGLRIIDGQQRIPVATAVFAGLGIRVRTVDHRTNPRRGLVVETSIERGRKDRSLRVVRADTTEEKTRLRQARLHVSTRLFVPTVRRQTLVLGGETMLLRSRELDESDLIRFGGARSLRGYDEERFRVPFASRVLMEYRYLLDDDSHALAFFDLGYIDASRMPEPYSGFYPGFGVGFQLATDAGLISLTAAASTEAPSEVRAHMSISLGL